MMKLVFLRSLAHKGQRRSRVIWLAALPLALSLFMALIPFTSPAFAATHTQTTSYVAVATSVRSIGVIQGHHFSVVSTFVTSQGASINASSTNTISHEYDWFDTGIRIFSITMTTSWCYNFVTVTCHHTTLLGNITTAGKLEGYSFNGSYNTFNCYVAAGAPGKPPSGCSGNHEHMWQSFATPLFPAGLEIQMSIDEEENYKGQSFWQVNHAYCPGYCGSSGISWQWRTAKVEYGISKCLCGNAQIFTRAFLRCKKGGRQRHSPFIIRSMIANTALVKELLARRVIYHRRNLR